MRAAIQRKKSEDPPNDSARLTRVDTRGGREGGPPTQQRTLTARRQGMEGDTPTRQGAPPARIQGKDAEEGGAPLEQQHTLPVYDLQEREGEGGTPPEQEGEEMSNPEQKSALPAHGTLEREGRAPI